MTSIVDVTGMERAALDERVLEMVSDGFYKDAADMIADWVEWDWHGRWSDIDEAAIAVPLVKPKKSSKPSVAARLTEEFGSTGPAAS